MNLEKQHINFVYLLFLKFELKFTLNYKCAGESSIMALLNKLFDAENSQATSIGLITFGSLLAGIWTIDISYLEKEGLTWIQMFVIAETSCLLYTSFAWITYMLYQWKYNYDSIIEKNVNCTSFTHYLLSIFPSISDVESWKPIIGGGLCWGFGFQFYVLGLFYCDSGDSILFRTTFASVGVVIAGMIAFGEKISISVVMSLLLAIFGIALVCQPSFIFNNDSNDNSRGSVSMIGLVYLFLSGSAKTCSKTLVKYSGNLNVSLWALMIGNLIVTTIFSWVEFICVCVFHYYKDGKKTFLAQTFGTKIWYSDYDTGSTTGITIITGIVLYGVILTANMAMIQKGHQIGDLGKLGIICLIDVPFTYLLQIWIFNEESSYLVYFGVAVVLVAVCLLYWEKFSRRVRAQLERKTQETDPLLVDNIDINVVKSDRVDNEYQAVA